MTKRSKRDPAGDITKKKVQDANTCGQLVAQIVMLCRALHIHFVMEQPSTSVLKHYSPVKASLDAATAGEVSVQLGRVGAASVKPLALCGTPPWLPGLAAQIKNRPLTASSQPLAARKGPWVSGKQDLLAESASYPETLCTMVARMHLAYMGVFDADRDLL